MTLLKNSRRRVLWSMSIVMLSLGIAIGTVTGVWVTDRSTNELDPAVSDFFGIPAGEVNATATHGIEKFAIATGMLDDQTEAIFFLDYLTAELKGAAISRQTSKFSSLYRRKILQDFNTGEDAESFKNPRFMMVTGLAQVQQRGGRSRVGRALIYVVEVNSGKAVAYAVPDARSSRVTGSATPSDLIKVDTLSLRGRGAIRPGSRD